MNDHSIHEAAKQGKSEIVHAWLQQDIQLLNYPNISHNTPLHLAAVHRHPETVKLLLRKGANFSLKNQSGYTPLAFMMIEPDITTEHQDAIALLLQHGDDPNQPIVHDNIPATRPIHLALHKGDATFLRLLLTYGADANIVDHKGRNGIQIILDRLHAALLAYDVIDEDESEYYILLRDDDIDFESRFQQYTDCLKILLLTGSLIEKCYFDHPLAEQCHATFDFSERLIDGEGVMSNTLVEIINDITNTTPSINEMIQILAYPFFKEIIQDTLALKQKLDKHLVYLEPQTIKKVALLPKEDLKTLLDLESKLALHRTKKLGDPSSNLYSKLLALPPEIMCKIWHWVVLLTNVDACHQEMALPDYDKATNMYFRNVSP